MPSAHKDHFREYYGNVEWAVRSIFAGTLGWCDSNPTTRFSLPVRMRCEGYGKLPALTTRTAFGYASLYSFDAPSAVTVTLTAPSLLTSVT